MILHIGITGSSGFLGGALVTEVIQRGHTPSPIRLPRNNDLRDSSYLEDMVSSGQYDAIIHTAVVRHPSTSNDYYLNAEFPNALERVFRLVNQKGAFVNISSLGVVVKSLQDAYTKSKREAELRLKGSRSLICNKHTII